MPSTSSAERTTTGTPRPGGAGHLAGRTVSRIGFGAMQLERLHDDRPAALALLRRAVELGVDHIDTAHFYGNGFVNGLLHEALLPEDDVLIATKVGGTANPGGEFPIRLAQRPEELRSEVEANLTSLGLDRIPLVNLRRADSPAGLRAEGEQIVDLDDQLATMIAMRDEGKIGAIGLSTVTLDGVRRALSAGIACVQNAYSLINREDEDLLRLCRAGNIAWVPFFPLGSAFDQWPKVTDEPTVGSAAEILNCTPAQVGLAWLLHHAPNILLIPGTADQSHLEANVAAGEIALDEEMLTSFPAPQPG